MRPVRGTLTLLVVCAILGCAEPLGDHEKDIESARSLFAAGHLREAEQLSKHLIASAPQNSQLRLLLGEIYLALGDGVAARAAFTRAVHLGAPQSSVARGVVRSLMLQGRYEDVLNEFSSLIRSTITDDLRLLRLEALLHVPLAPLHQIFEDAAVLLRSGGEKILPELEALAEMSTVTKSGADQLERAKAYWECESTTLEASSDFSTSSSVNHPTDLLYRPSWAKIESDGRRVLQVGPKRMLKRPSEAARIAQDGDIVEIASAVYDADVAVWNSDNLWLKSVGGLASLESGGRAADDMGIWVIRGDNTIIEGIRFIGARSKDKNGSGIRLLASNLWVRHSEFERNENGILGPYEPGGEVVVEHSVFAQNGAGDGYSHNVYVGNADRLIFRFNYSTGAKIGHQLKSRASENYVLYNRLSDEAIGNSSYTIDLPDGGLALILGNELQQGPLTENGTMISFGAERPDSSRPHRLVVAYNSFYNGSSPAVYIRDSTKAELAIINNVFAGGPAELSASNGAVLLGNVFGATAALRAPRTGNYSLHPNAFFIDQAEAIVEWKNVPITPRFEYVHRAGSIVRRPVWRPDPGAHEFCGWPGEA